MAVRSFVAMGDSFTEGLDDPYPDRSVYRGWADLVAQALAAEAVRAGGASGDVAGDVGGDRARAGGPGEPFRYANLAIRGRLFTGVVDEQVPLGLAMRPDLFAFAAGGNDALRRGFDPAPLVARFDQVVAQLRATGAEVLLFRFIDLSRRLPGKRVLRPRISVLNDGVTDTARRYGARAVDLWSDGDFDHPGLWSADRLHLSAAGHRRVAAHVLTTLGMCPDPAWLDLPVPVTPVAWAAARRSDVRWVCEHLGPWVGRRLTGRSSGDTRHPKRPRLSPVVPAGISRS